MNTETKHNQSQLVPHRWAEVIKAWADGKEIQWKYYEGDWKTYNQSNGISASPAFNDQVYEWRIKPQAKTGWINIYNDGTLSNRVHKTEERCCDMARCANGGFAANLVAIIQITYTEGEGL